MEHNTTELTLLKSSITPVKLFLQQLNLVAFVMVGFAAGLFLLDCIVSAGRT